ncbi:MAG: hypothetical protein KC731_41565 [Myxococcales bacterium]|nr:hypothetical protein [Myxococcales bacterium]
MTSPPVPSGKHRMTRLYDYVGPHHLVDLATSPIPRHEPTANTALVAWLREQYGNVEAITLTYVVTDQGRLRVSDRHTEHVACAQGSRVRAAGELELSIEGSEASVVGVTNQSTGYCPEPSCFPEVQRALLEAGLEPPDSFSHAFTFRRCPGCGGITIVKDDDFECPACGEALPREWNFGT